MKFKCSRCNEEYLEPKMKCSKCGGIIRVENKLSWSIKNIRSIWRYEGMMPKLKRIISLNEGLTPLVKAVKPPRDFKGTLYFKDESRNPTGSFRDRAASPIISHAYSLGVKRVICATDGNHGASIAAYASRCNIKCYAIVPSLVDPGKLGQMITYGCEVEEYGVHLDDAIDRALSISSRKGYYQATAELNPLSIEGLKTISYEIYEDLGEAVDWIVIPTGSGLTLYSMYIGFKELKDLGVIDKIPRFLIVQSLHSNPIVLSVEETTVKGKDTPIMGLNVLEPILLEEIVAVLKEVRGRGVIVTYSESLNAGRELASSEGLFVELAAAAGYAGFKKALSSEVIGFDENVVLVITSSGLKAVEIYTQPARRRQLLRFRGLDMKASILELLKTHGPCHGYVIWKGLGEKISPQAIYQHLSELESLGLIYSEYIGRRKVFHLTKKGVMLLKLLEIKE